MIKLSVIGTKDFDSYQLLKRELQKEVIDVIVTGGKLGPDILLQEYAHEFGIQSQIYLPDYRKYGRSANYQRNLDMIRNSSRVIIFWNQLSKSPFNYLPYLKEQRKSFRTVIY